MILTKIICKYDKGHVKDAANTILGMHSPHALQWCMVADLLRPQCLHFVVLSESEGELVERRENDMKTVRK